MFVLTRGVAILGTHTRLAHLEASAPLLAAFSAAHPCVNNVIRRYQRRAQHDCQFPPTEYPPTTKT